MFPYFARKKLKDYGKTSIKSGSFISGKRIFYSLPNAVCCFELHLFTASFQMLTEKMGYSALCQVRSQVRKTGTQETNLWEVWCETLRCRKRKEPIFSGQLIFNSDHATLRNFHKKWRSSSAVIFPHAVPTQPHGTSLWILSTIKNKRSAPNRAKLSSSAPEQLSTSLRLWSARLQAQFLLHLNGFGFFFYVMNITEIYFPYDSTKAL